MQKNAIRDIVPESMNLRGFFRGVVEDNNDPLKVNRVRVRVFGLHTDKKEKDKYEGVPTVELPWAEPCLSVAEGSVSGFGLWGVPLQGSHVMLFFENENPQKPMYFASVPGIPSTAPDTSVGFNDPAGSYPTSIRIGESDVHRLARGVSSATIVEYKNNNLDTGVSTALGGTFSEPSSPFAATYPHNTVFATHGGVIIEMDSTPGATRFQIYHPSNSFIEVDNDGTMVIKNEKDKYEITAGSRNIHIKQNDNITADGNKKDKVGGSKEEEVVGNKDEEVGGNESIEIGGTKDEEVTGAVTETFSAGQTTTVTGALNITVSGVATITAPSTIITGGTVQLAAQTPADLKKILNEDAITRYNEHKHYYPDGFTTNSTDTPIQQMNEGDHATSNTTAT